MSISAKSAASTPPAPERIVMTASRSSYSPLSKVRTSSSPMSFFSLFSSRSASTMVAASSSSVPSWTSTSSSSMRSSISTIRSSSELARDRRLVTTWALAGSSHRSGAPDCSSSSLIWVRSESRSVTCRTDSMVERRSLSSSAKSTATTSQTTRLLPKSGPGTRLDGDVYRATEGRENGGGDRDVGGAPQPDDRRLPVRAAGAIGQDPQGDTEGSRLNSEILRRCLTDRSVAYLDRRPQTSAVCRTAVQGVRSVQSGTVSGIEQSGPGELNRGHVNAADNEHQRDAV